MTEVFDLIFYAVKSIYVVLSSNFILEVYGFSFSLWDFLVALFILSSLVPLVSFCSTSGISDVVGYIFKSESERIKESKELAKQREQERINAEKVAYIRSALRSREAYNNYANRRGLPDKGNVIYGHGEERKKLK